MNSVLKGVLVAVAAGLIGWAAWVTLGVANAATEERVETIQMRIEDKLDKIQETILELHKR
jgi:hypothetical protein